MSAVRLANLYALRAHLDAMIMAEETEQGLSQPTRQPGGCPQCGAPADKVEDDSTIGQKASKCTVCGAEWDRP